MASSDCDQIAGQVLRPMFGQELNAERLESLILRSHNLSATDLQRRQDQEQDLFCLDWQKDGVCYTAGLQHAELLFVNMRFEPARLSAGQAIACLGSPPWYQSWYDSYPGGGFSSAHIALVYPAQSSVVYCSGFFDFAAQQPPAIDDHLPVTMISIFGAHWRDDERILGKSKPWPGSWAAIEIETHVWAGQENGD